ncbi:hypothetical protein JYT20_01660 [Rhodothermus sp. AH-315-K08]|nr:hypothetical protein [Rhodothermus sp. AH-315-K08]
MKHARRQTAKPNLERLLAANPTTEGMYVRAWGDHLIIGREEPYGPDGALVPDDRVRFTARTASSWGLGVRRHTGRWEKTPFTGTLEELYDIVGSLMQHLVASHS